MRPHGIAYRTHAFARYESRKRASHPISATNGYAATIRCGRTAAVQRIMQTSAERWPLPTSQSVSLSVWEARETRDVKNGYTAATQCDLCYGIG